MTPAIVRFKNKFANYLTGTVSIPIIAQLWVIPIQIFYFSNISVFSVLANIMSVPILAVISFGGFISALLCAIKPFASFICMTFDFVLNPVLTLLINISDFWGHLPNATIQTTHPNVFQILVYYGILLCITAFLYKDFREKYMKIILKSFLGLLAILLLTLIPVKNKNLEIITFDVGNADCFLLKTPQNEFIMIDSGKSGYNGGKSQAEIIMLKYLKDIGIKKLHSLIITHFDNDHCGGAVDIMNKLDVEKVYLNDLNHTSHSAKSIYNTAKNKNIKILLASNNQLIYNNNGLKLTNLVGSNTDDDNENSIITLLEYKKFKMLFTGDASFNGIKQVLNYIPQNITVLKVPHHGAIGGLETNLVHYLNPKYSIISVGENMFGHPAQYTLSILNKSNILRTDINNSILIKVTENSYKIYTYDSRKRKYILNKNN